MTRPACEQAPCHICKGWAWTCELDECRDPSHAGSCELSGGGWVCSETCWETAAERSERNR